MRKIVMLDSWTVCDDKGDPCGHGWKVSNEYYNYLCDDFDVVQYVNSDMLPYINNKRAKPLPFSTKRTKNKFEKIVIFWKNLKYIYYNYSNAIIWLYVPNIYSVVSMILLPKKNRSLVSLMYEDYSSNKIKEIIFKIFLLKTDLVFVTNKKLLNRVNNGVLIPDYSYNTDFYSKYKKYPKKERVICLGTMNSKKRLDEAVDAFAKNGYPLYIAGVFENKETYKRLQKNKADNILIEDRFVNSNEYYELMGSSKFCLAPYDESLYKNRTSGVIQESIFMGAIPITCKSILKFLDIKGVGYKKISDLSTFDFMSYDSKMDLQYNSTLIESFYNEENTKQTFKIEFLKLMENRCQNED